MRVLGACLPMDLAESVFLSCFFNHEIPVGIVNSQSWDADFVTAA